MTTRDEFEKWARGTLPLDKEDDGGYKEVDTYWAYKAWRARQQEIDALKAEIEKLKSNDHIADISKMVFPPDQLEHKLDMVPADNQDALDATRYRFLKANLVGGFDLPGLYSLDVIDHESWDATIDESMKHATGGFHE